MRFNKKQGHFLGETIAQWEQDGTINAETAGTLRGSYAIRSFDWNRLAKYSFIIAIVCAIIAFSAIVADEYLVELLMHYVDILFNSSDAALSLIFGIMAAVVFYAGYVCRKKYPKRLFSNEAVLFCAVVLAASSIAFFGKAVDSGSGHFSLLLLIAAVLYGVIGLAFKSKLVWIFSLLSLGSWFGAETGYVSGWGAYFLGMYYPLRFVIFGAVLVVVALGVMRSPSGVPIFRTSKPFSAPAMSANFHSSWNQGSSGCLTRKPILTCSPAWAIPDKQNNASNTARKPVRFAVIRILLFVREPKSNHPPPSPNLAGILFESMWRHCNTLPQFDWAYGKRND